MGDDNVGRHPEIMPHLGGIRDISNHQRNTISIHLWPQMSFSRDDLFGGGGL